MEAPLQIQFVSGGVLRLTFQDGALLGAGQLDLEGIEHGQRDLVLYVEDIARLDLAVIPVRPQLASVGGVDELGRVFDDTMTAISALWAPAIAAAYDFGRWGTVTDVGGGNGLLLAEILRVYPGLRGVLADEAPVLERARQRGLVSGALADRVRFEPSNFFEAVPSGSRAYLMKNIIHDWNDDDARRILLNCRRAVPDDGVLLLVEYCVGDASQQSRECARPSLSPKQILNVQTFTSSQHSELRMAG
jgi:hypothetical protein